MKILIVDADWRFVQQTRNFLESHAHLVVHQNSVHGAISQANHWQPDLVILSAQLAEDQLVNSLHSAQKRPAILLTESMERYDRAWRAWQKCGDELLMKPVFKSQELQEAIVHALENATLNTHGRGYSMAASA